jgi:hypothetical protein
MGSAFRLFSSLLVIGSFFLAAQAPAQTQTILLRQAELDALQVLAKFNDFQVYMHGQMGRITPPAAIRYLGVPILDFELELSKVMDMVNLRFNDVNSNGASLTMSGDSIELKLHFEDRDKELLSRVGSIDLSNFHGYARMKVENQAGGDWTFTPVECEIRGEMKGTGLLSNKWVLERVRILVQEEIKRQLETIFGIRTRDQKAESLLTWAAYSTGSDWKSVVPGSVKIESGILVYSVER